MVDQPEMEVTVDSTSYWLPADVSFSRTWLDEKSFSCFAEFDKVDMLGKHSLRIEQKSPGSMQLGTLLSVTTRNVFIRADEITQGRAAHRTLEC